MPAAAGEEPPTPPPAAEIKPALAKAIRAVKTDKQWEDLMADFEAAGMSMDEKTAVELDEIGEEVVDGQIDAEQAAARIGSMAEDAARQSGVPRPTCGGGRGWPCDCG